jgi:hypothetical protein
VSRREDVRRLEGRKKNQGGGLTPTVRLRERLPTLRVFRQDPACEDRWKRTFVSLSKDQIPVTRLKEAYV